MNAPLNQHWLTDALTSSVAGYCALVGAVGVVVLLLGARVLWAVRRRQTMRQAMANVSECDGTATIEFALVMPVLLFVVLALVQTALVMGGNIFVHYAAFAATRSAIVQIPIDYYDETGNVIINDQYSLKLHEIKKAAVYALIPVSGRLASGTAPAQAYTDALRTYYNNYGMTPPRWIETQAGQRLHYADAHTSVEVLETVISPSFDVAFYEIGDSHLFGPKDPVTVRVSHELNLSVPWVRFIFSDGYRSSDSGRFTTVVAQYTLTNEGISPYLPAASSLPRQP